MTPTQLLEDNIVPVASQPATRFQTIYNRTQKSINDGEVNTQPSKTIPDQSLTVAELVYRFSHGQSLGGQRTPVYDDDNEIQFPVNWDKMDLSEKMEFMEEKTKEVKEISDRLQQAKLQQMHDAREKEIKRRVDAKIQAVRDSREAVRPTAGATPNDLEQ